ncbi:hypothetical protein LCGC14_0992420 [marine sediment metagenome]|uniref:V-type ATP synthase subunit I n=1 Tax=marine sediment metagenome TaxID=412755 RepID=A0A0F9N5I6_9ZZZZ
MLVTMAKIEIIGPKKYFDKAIALLQQLGTLDIEDLSKRQDDLLMKQMSMGQEDLESRNHLRDLLTRLNGVMSILGPLADHNIKEEDEQVWERDNSYLAKRADKVLGAVEEKTRELASRKKQLELETASLDRYQKVLQKVYPLAKKIMPTQDSETVAFILEGDYKETVNAVEEEMGRITESNFELISAPIDEDTTAAIVVFNKKYLAKVHSFLSNTVNEIEAPTGTKDLSIDKVLGEIEKKQQNYPKKLAEIKQKLIPIAAEWHHKIKAISNAIHNKVDQIEAIPSFGQTDYAFVLHAWLPQRKLKNMEKELGSRWGEKIFVRQLELDHHDLEEAPVAVENPGWAKPYEVFMNIFQPPKYGTLDPTMFLALFFPIFFGFIVGDVGYGAIILITSTVLRMKFMKDKGDMVDATTRIFQLAGVSAILFGIFYGEGFGTLLEHYLHNNHIEYQIGPIHWPYVRDPDIPNRLYEFLYASIAIGYVHLVISVVMGIINARREKAYKHLWEKVGTLGFMVVIAILVIIAFTKGSFEAGVETYFATALGVVSIGLVVYGGGVLAVMESTFGIIGNLASYLRLMSLGFAGAILAGVANEIGAGSFIGIFLAIFLHVINVVVSTVSPAIHSFRLNLLEGFGKFYEEGSREYKPFFARR